MPRRNRLVNVILGIATGLRAGFIASVCTGFCLLALCTLLFFFVDANTALLIMEIACVMSVVVGSSFGIIAGVTDVSWRNTISSKIREFSSQPIEPLEKAE
jgi:hypothetical protein